MGGYESETSTAYVREIGLAWAIAVLTIVVALGIPLV